MGGALGPWGGTGSLTWWPNHCSGVDGTAAGGATGAPTGGAEGPAAAWEAARDLSATAPATG